MLDLCYKKLGWTIKGPEEYSLEKPDLSLHKAELSTELASAKNADDSASGPLTQLKRKQSAAPLNNALEDNDAFYARVRSCLVNAVSSPFLSTAGACVLLLCWAEQTVQDKLPRKCTLTDCEGQVLCALWLTLFTLVATCFTSHTMLCLQYVCRLQCIKQTVIY